MANFKINMHICRATANQVFYFVGLANSTPTVVCALNNVIPAATFVLAALCRYQSHFCSNLILQLFVNY